MQHPTRLVIVLAAALGLAPAALGYTLVNERVEMSDGVGLSTDVYLPDTSEGPWPTLLARSPYTIDSYGGGLVLDGLLLATNLGYAVVIQDTRGTGDSEGDAQPFSTDRADGLETLDWLLTQPWCAGDVELVGASAIGIPGYLMAPGADPAMQCQGLAISTPDVYAHAAYQGGALRESDVTSWTSWLDLPELVPQVLEHRDCDAFWAPVRVSGMGADVRAAGLHVGGWYDLFVQGNLDGFAMYRQSTDPEVADHQYLVVGPWYHHGVGQTSVGEVTLPATAKWDLAANLMAWTAWCFKGTGVVNNWPRVKYWVFGAFDEPGAPGNVWRTADDWPPPAVETPLYLAPGGLLTPALPSGALEASVPFDPSDPSPTHGGRNLAIDAGPRDQSLVVEARPDALLFTSEPLVEPLEIVGRVSVRLRVATDGPDGDVAVRLTDVYPDGRSLLITDGIQRLSRRDGCEHEVAVVPGEPVDVTVDLWSAAWIFNAGHRVRLVVTGSNWPRFERTPTLLPPDGAPLPVTLTLTSTPEAPAALLVPVPLPPQPPDLPDSSDVALAESEPEAPAEVPPDVQDEPPAGEVVGATDLVDEVDPGAADAAETTLDVRVDTGLEGGPTDHGADDEATRPDTPNDVARDGAEDSAAVDAGTDASAGTGSSGGCSLQGYPTSSLPTEFFVLVVAAGLTRRLRLRRPTPSARP